MRTLDNQGKGGQHGWIAQRQRDIRLLRRLLGMTFYYLTGGRHIRRHYAALGRSGKTYWLDAPGSTGDEKIQSDAPEWRAS